MLGLLDGAMEIICFDENQRFNECLALLDSVFYTAFALLRFYT